MPSPSAHIAFAVVALDTVLTPGPNLIYLVSRSITQGVAAGLVLLAGVRWGFIVHLLAVAFGVTALLLAVPLAFDALRGAGALYLVYLAWQSVKSGGRSPIEVTRLPVDPPARLFAFGFLTNVLNSKVAVLYLSLLPQFFDPSRGNVLCQGLVLGIIQICVSLSVNVTIAASSGSVAVFFV